MTNEQTPQDDTGEHIAPSALNAELCAWIQTAQQLPEINPNSAQEFIVACRREHNGKTHVFAANYLNAMMLFTSDDDCPEDGKPFTGWYLEKSDDPDYDNSWWPVCQDGDSVTHWMPFPPGPN